ncbi:hypothetical protein RHCRD62_10246 [Rhodococcus sp. RD6.2]|nr:hypothetical protein RHCRD62_10246 [Rhodococcus sp. RD6.2]
MGEDHGEPDDDERDDGDDLDESEPELGFTEGLHRREVERDQEYDGGERRDPQGQRTPPVGHVAGDRDDVGDAGDDPAEPVRPAGEEAGPRSEVVACEVGEGPVPGVRQQQFAHRPHDEEQHRADDHVDEQHRGPGQGDGLARAHEQAGADGTADRHELDVPVGQLPGQAGFSILGRDDLGVFGHWVLLAHGRAVVYASDVGGRRDRARRWAQGDRYSSERAGRARSRRRRSPSRRVVEAPLDRPDQASRNPMCDTPDSHVDQVGDRRLPL